MTNTLNICRLAIMQRMCNKINFGHFVTSWKSTTYCGRFLRFATRCNALKFAISEFLIIDLEQIRNSFCWEKTIITSIILYHGHPMSRYYTTTTNWGSERFAWQCRWPNITPVLQLFFLHDIIIICLSLQANILTLSQMKNKIGSFVLNSGAACFDGSVFLAP